MANPSLSLQYNFYLPSALCFSTIHSNICKDQGFHQTCYKFEVGILVFIRLISTEKMLNTAVVTVKPVCKLPTWNKRLEVQNERKGYRAMRKPGLNIAYDEFFPKSWLNSTLRPALTLFPTRTQRFLLPSCCQRVFFLLLSLATVQRITAFILVVLERIPSPFSSQCGSAVVHCVPKMTVLR